MTIKDYVLWPRAYWNFKHDLKATPNWMRITDNLKISGTIDLWAVLGILGLLLAIMGAIAPFIRPIPAVDVFWDRLSLLTVIAGGLMTYFAEGYVVRGLIKQFKF